MIALDIAVMFSITIGIVTGLNTLKNNHDFFAEFVMVDFFNGRYDSWLYVCNSLSTALCCVDLFLRGKWVFTIGWDESGDVWRISWLLLHFLLAVNSILIHVTTDRLLRRSEFCNLCKRKYKHGDSMDA